MPDLKGDRHDLQPLLMKHGRQVAHELAHVHNQPLGLSPPVGTAACTSRKRTSHANYTSHLASCSCKPADQRLHSEAIAGGGPRAALAKDALCLTRCANRLQQVLYAHRLVQVGYTCLP